MNSWPPRHFLARLADRRAARLLGAALLLNFGPVLVARADNYYWDPTQTGAGAGSGGTGTWNTTSTFWHPANGTGDVAWPNSAANTADFAGTAGTVTLGSSITAGGLIFDATGYTLATAANTLSLGASGITQNVAAATISGSGGLALTAAQTWTVASGCLLSVTAPVNLNANSLTISGAGNLTISGIISGTGNLTKNSTGAFTLSGANTYTGTATINAGALTFANTAAQTLSGVVSGVGALSQTGSGTTTLTGSNTYSGGTTITSGTLVAQNNASANSLTALGIGTVTLNGGTNGLLSLKATPITSGAAIYTGDGTGTAAANNTSIVVGPNGGYIQFSQASGSNAGIYQLNTLSIGAATLTTTGNSGSAGNFLGATTLTGNATFNIGNASSSGALTFSGAIGDGGNAYGITKTTGGGSTLTLAAANTYTGTTNVGLATSSANAGTLTVNGLNGSIASSSAISVNGNGSQLLLDNANVTTTPDRIGNATPVTISNLGEFRFNNSNTVSTSLSETVGTLTLNTGTGIVSNSNGSSGTSTSTLNFGGFSRGANFATGLIRGTNLGFGNNGSYARVTLSDLSGLIQIGTATASNGNESGTTKNLAIVPYLTGATAVGSVGTNFVAYDTSTGFRRLADNEQSLITAASTGDNVKISAGGNAVSGAQTFNSLLLNAGGTASATPGTAASTVTGDGNSLTLTSGALANVATSATGTVTLSGFSSIIFGNGSTNTTTTINEAVITNANSAGALTISSPVNTFAAGGGLTKAGAGNLILTAAELYTGQTTINQGTLTIGNGTAGSLAAGSGPMLINPGATLALVQPIGSTFNNNIVNNGALAVANAGTLALSGNISGISGLTQATTGTTLVLSGANTYTGATAVSAGALNLTGSLTGTAITVSGTGVFTEASSGAISGNSVFTLTAGTATLAGSNMYTGATTLTAGTLDVNSAGALGSGLVTFSGGTIDNTSGVAITTQTNNPTSLVNGNFTFGGTNSLNLGTGAAAINFDRTITLSGNNANTLTFGGLLSNTRNNTGINIAVNNASGVSGETIVFAGGFAIATTGATASLASIVSGNGNQTYSGAIINGDAYANALTVASTGSVIFTAANTYTGGTTISSGSTLQLGYAGTTGSLSTTGGVADAGTLLINRTNAVVQSSSFGTIAGAGAVNLAGTGTTTFTAANTYTGGTTVNRGTLDLGGSTSVGSIGAGALTLGGGTLNYTRTGTNTQGFTSTTLNSGGSGISTALSTETITLGAITRNAGSTVNFNNAGTITTTTANTNGILGGYATYGLNTWAVSAGTGTAAGNITGLAQTVYAQYNNVSGLVSQGYNSTTNLTDVEGYDGTYTTNLNLNTLRFNSGTQDGNLGIVSGNNLTITAGGGILVTNNVGSKYQRIGYLNTNFNAGEGQGGLTLSASGDLVINQNNSGSGHLEIYSTIYGTGVNLVKSGVGYLEVRGLDASYTGATIVNGGTMKLTAATTGTTNVTVNNTGTLLLGANDRVNDAATVTLNGGTINTGGFQEGRSTGAAAATAGLGALTLTYSSTLDFGSGHSGSSVLAFANSAGSSWSANNTYYSLTLLNFTPGTDFLNFTSPTGLTPTQLGEISLSGFSAAGLDSFGNVLFSPVPEPATWAAGVLLVGAAGWQLRRRVLRRAA